MTLAAPLFLLLLLLLPLGWWAGRVARQRRRRHAIRMPATATLQAIVAAQPSYRRWVPVALLAVTVVLLTVALTRPEVTVSVPVERATVILVTDASGSMAATDVPPSRIDAARNAAESFLDEIPKQTRVGLVGYSSSPHTVQPPTTDRDLVRRDLLGLEPDGGTSTGDALVVALDALESEGDPAPGTEGKKPGAGDRPPGAILLLSDGASMTGENPIDVARRAKRDGVPIYTVSLGTDQGTVSGPQFGGTIPVPPDPESMREIARISGGQSFTVDDAGELRRIYDQVGARVATEPEQRELTAGFAALGLLLLGLAVGLGVRWRGRVG